MPSRPPPQVLQPAGETAGSTIGEDSVDSVFPAAPLAVSSSIKETWIGPEFVCARAGTPMPRTTASARTPSGQRRPWRPDVVGKTLCMSLFLDYWPPARWAGNWLG